MLKILGLTCIEIFLLSYSPIALQNWSCLCTCFVTHNLKQDHNNSRKTWEYPLPSPAEPSWGFFNSCFSSQLSIPAASHSLNSPEFWHRSSVRLKSTPMSIFPPQLPNRLCLLSWSSNSRARTYCITATWPYLYIFAKPEEYMCVCAKIKENSLWFSKILYRLKISRQFFSHLYFHNTFLLFTFPFAFF